VKTRFVKAFLLWLLLSAPMSFAAPPDGIWQGYDGEWRHVSRQLIALAEATPAEKFAWRPAAGVRSTSEVYMHIAMANFYLLSVTGPKMPAGLKEDAEKTVTSKAEVIDLLKRSREVFGFGIQSRTLRASVTAVRASYSRSLQSGHGSWFLSISFPAFLVVVNPRR
jgi:hypothetical protein